MVSEALLAELAAATGNVATATQGTHKKDGYKPAVSVTMLSCWLAMAQSMAQTDLVLTVKPNGRWEKVATLEFDRNRKSMSVIACAPQASSSTASGVTTRSAASRHSSLPSNVLFVKGAAEYMLSRCSKVCGACSA